MPVLPMLLWLLRPARRRPAADRRGADDPRERRRVRPALELLESRLAPGNLLFADGMAMTSLLSPNTATVAAAPGDPMPNPLAATPPAPTETTGMDLYSPAPAAAGSASASSAPMPSSSSPEGSGAEPLSGYADSSSPNISYMPTFSGQAGGASSSGSSMIPSYSSSSSSGGMGFGSSSSSSSSPTTVGGFVVITGIENSKGQPLPNSEYFNDPRPTVVGTGTAGETLSFRIDGAASGSTTVGANGQWAWTVPNALAQGSHTLQVTTGGAGFTSMSTSTTFFVELTPPTVTLTAPPLSDYQPPLLTVTAASTNASGLNPTVHIDVDLQHDGSFTDPGDKDFGIAQLQSNGTASFFLMTPLPAGVYSLRARVDDQAGNEGVSAISTMVVNPTMGYIGSQPLLDLALGVPYGTAVPIPGNPGDTPTAPPPGTTSQGEPGTEAPNYPGVTTPASGGLGYGPASGSGSGMGYGSASGSGSGMGYGSASGSGSGSGTGADSGFDFLEFDNQGRVLVDVHSTLSSNLNGLVGKLTSQYGFSTVNVYPSQNMVQGWLPVNQILNLPMAANFGSVDPVYKPILRVSDANGDALIKGPEFRSSQGVTGAGEKVGVISDSVNQYQGGLAESVAAGALPNNVDVLGDDPDGGGTDEGRAMLEEVHQVAPGAALAFDASGDSPQSTAASIGALAGAGSNVIADDIGFFNEPFFNDGVISQAAEAAVNQGVFYASAAGNDGNHGYLANWTPVTATVGGVTGTFQNIQGGSALQTFTLPVGETVLLSFEWSAAFLEGGGTGNFTVPNDLQVLVTNGAGSTLEESFDSMGTSINEADQIVQFTNDGSFGTSNFAFAFNLVSGPAPSAIAWVSQDGAGPYVDPVALDEGGPTDYGHPTAPGVVGVGATDVLNPTTPESFSSQGGFPLLFNDAGAPQAAIATGPVVTAPDDITVSFQLGGAPTFQGTSAATPQVAGAAALLLQNSQNQDSPAQVTQYLKANAIALPDPTVTGAGLIQLNGPLSAAPPAPPGPQATQFADDRFESNDTSDQASQMGLLGSGTTEVDGLTINYNTSGAPDYDWYQWTLSQAGTVTATENTTTPGTPTGNLELHLFTLSGNTLVDLGDSTAPGMSHSVSAVLAAGSTVLVEVKGHETQYGIMDQGAYNLIVDVQ